MKSNDVQVNVGSSSEEVIKKEGEVFQLKNRFGKFFYAICVGIIAALVVIADFFISPIFVLHGSFVWIAFINWTLFSSSSNLEKLKAIGGYVTGYFCANGMIMLGGYLTSKFNWSSVSFPVGAVIATFLFNALIMRYGISKRIITSISSIFIGMSLTFSGLGVKMNTNDLNMLFIIVTYGIIGLLCCVACDFCAKKFLKND